MNILKRLSGMFFVVAVMALSGCGGGGGATQPTTATLKLSSVGAAGTAISGIEVTVVLPTGVTVAATTTIDPAVMETNAGVVVLSGATVTDPAAFSQLKPTAAYTPAVGAVPGKVKILLPAQKDFGLGEYVTLNTVIAAGNNPVTTDFKLEDFKAVTATTGGPIAGVTSTFSADIK